ncbi:rCG30363 [Rattus norvegicus]|uniref:RCG30363 n=1 Tax=Rattus norvegicus TaxID=10116 RepID=A6JFS1_RAT|nr:rCG30363 [Rattus norvegicus]
MEAEVKIPHCTFTATCALANGFSWCQASASKSVPGRLIYITKFGCQHKIWPWSPWIMASVC